ncbi:MAG: hypothetical protein COA79_20610 [Planctomycetota bacterium]|nr:MAG: hypothetical protein COA79_20610 [Planctomycetota bacterium]
MNANMEFKTKLLFEENFENDLDQWWVEGQMDVFTNDHKIYVDIDKPGQNKGASGTVWLKQKHPENFIITYNALVEQSGIGANNINLFLCYNHPNDKPMIESRDERESGAYNLYHELNGYIITYLNDYDADSGKYPDGSTKARIRMRKNPGFNLVNEDYTYHCKQNNLYQFEIIKFKNKLILRVDGEERLSWEDLDGPYGEGLIGLRTFQSKLYWEKFKLFKILD